MSRRLPLCLATATAFALLFAWLWERVDDGPAGIWKAGVASASITPAEAMWMSGYASRDQPSSGTLTPLWAKALAVEDPAGQRVLLVTMDLIGIDRALSAELCQSIGKRHGLERSAVLLSTSHTHTGPVVGANLQAMYALPPDEQARVDSYTQFLREAVLSAADRAVANLAPSALSYGEGMAAFAVNRRNNREDEVEAAREAGTLRGPVDHAVPVLKITSGESLRAVLFGYACHATVLSSFEWSGDYPGFAQARLEERYPGATALFWAGCGADSNPLPRRTVERAREYGVQLAEAVSRVLEADSGSALQPVQGRLTTVYEEISLDFAEVPSRADLEARREDENPYVARTAAHLLASPDRMEMVRSGYPYPVQTWGLGKDLKWIALGGEVVVDYALEIKKILGDRSSVWVAGYCNDVMAYIPSLRVLQEGGYEGGGSMIYYGLPGPWAEDVEARILATVKRQSATLSE